MKKVLAVAIIALATAAPAAATSSAASYTARGSGTVLMNGTTGPMASFTIDFSRGRGHKVVFVDRRTGVSFHSQQIRSLRFSDTAVKIVGVGFANGKRVPFTAIATEHLTSLGDWFKISWGGGPSYGGRLMSGSIDIQALIAAVGGGGNRPTAA